MKMKIPTVRLALETKQALEARAERLAAVAAILREQAESLEVLLIRRAITRGDPWSGHMAFPGGRQAPEDYTLYGTALRETAEEIGLDLEQQAELLGRLDDVTAVARGKRLPMVIRPFVFGLRDNASPALRPEPSEVAEALWVPIEPLMSGARDTHIDYEHNGQRLKLPGFRVNSHIVWGLTHGMLTSLFARLDAPAIVDR